jgi:hypothetical protein
MGGGLLCLMCGNHSNDCYGDCEERNCSGNCYASLHNGEHFCFPKTHYDIMYDNKNNHIRQLMMNRDDYFAEIYEEWVDTFDPRDIVENKLYDKIAIYIKTYYATQYIVWDLLKKEGLID